MKIGAMILCGGALLQTTGNGCSEVFSATLSSLIPQLVLGLLSGFLGV